MVWFGWEISQIFDKIIFLFSSDWNVWATINTFFTTWVDAVSVTRTWVEISQNFHERILSSSDWNVLTMTNKIFTTWVDAITEIGTSAKLRSVHEQHWKYIQGTNDKYQRVKIVSLYLISMFLYTTMQPNVITGGMITSSIFHS